MTALLAEAGSSVLPSKRRCKEKALYIAFIVFVCIVTFVTICGMLCTAIINQCSHKRNKIKIYTCIHWGLLHAME